MGSFCQNPVQFQLKKYRRVSHDTEEWWKVWRKTGLQFQTWQGIWWIFTQPLKSLKISLRWDIFVQSIKVWDKKYSEQWCKISVNLDLVLSKLAWGIGWTFIKALKNLKICTLMGFSCSKRNWRENWLVAWKMTRNLVNFNARSWLKILSFECFCRKHIKF